MKKSIFTLFAVFMCLASYAQGFDQTKLRVGAGFMYGSEINSAAFVVKGVYAFADQWEGSVSFNRFFEKDYSTWSVIDLDGHYVHQLQDRLSLYGLAGMAINFWKVHIPEQSFGNGYSFPAQTHSGTHIGLNIGGGVNYALTEQFSFAPEARFTISEGSFLRIGATLQYRF